MSRGRGQPPKILPARYDEVLVALRAGLSMPATARKLGVTRATLYNLADRDEQMGAAMQQARQEARSRHRPSESCYVNRDCRTPECTREATEARARRRAAAYDLASGTPTRLADTA